MIVLWLSLFGSGLTTVRQEASSSPSPSAETSPPPSQTPPQARATPEGTPAPPPSAPVENPPPVQISVPPAPRETPTPEPGLWRIQGHVVDEASKPLENVCVVVGPRGCQRYSPHTDERGHFFLDVAAGDTKTAFDFYFEIPGYQTVWVRVIPSGPGEFNVMLKRG